MQYQECAYVQVPVLGHPFIFPYVHSVLTSTIVVHPQEVSPPKIWIYHKTAVRTVIYELKSKSLLLVEYKLCIRNLHCRWGICSKNGRRNVVFISCMYCLFLNINILFHLIEALKLRFKSDNLKIYILENTVFINFCFTNHSLLME